jgi:hypothetical protein
VVNNNYKSVPEHIFHPKVKQIPLVSHDTPNMELTRVHYNKKNKKFCLNFFFFFLKIGWLGVAVASPRGGYHPPCFIFLFIIFFKKKQIFLFYLFIFLLDFIFFYCN